MSVLNKSGFDGQRLRRAREFCDLTQKQLGEKVAASHAMVSLCESGKRTEPAADLVEAFGTLLGFETDFFISIRAKLSAKPNAVSVTVEAPGVSQNEDPCAGQFLEMGTKRLPSAP